MSPRKIIRRIIARFRLNKKIVCEESASMGAVDFHDFYDSQSCIPWHMALHTCKRCGKKFII